MSATLWSDGFTLMSAAMGTKTGPHLRINPPIRKVRSGAVNNASQLKSLLELELIIWVFNDIPKKERSESLTRGNGPSF